MGEPIYLLPVKIGRRFQPCLMYSITVLSKSRLAAGYMITLRALEDSWSIQDVSSFPVPCNDAKLGKNSSLAG